MEGEGPVVTVNGANYSCADQREVCCNYDTHKDSKHHKVKNGKIHELYSYQISV